MEAEHGIPSFLAGDIGSRRQLLVSRKLLCRTALAIANFILLQLTPIRELSVWLWWYLEIVFKNEIPPQEG